MASTVKTWSELSPASKRTLVAAAAAVHVCLVGAAHRDLSRRPAEQIRGPKWMWRLATAVNSSFTMVYFLWGNRKRDDGSSAS